MAKKNKPSKDWINKHINDPYVNLAKKENYRSRAVYKLKEIDQALRLFAQAKIVIDLGCAPGSWAQYALEKVPKDGRVIGIDILMVEPLRGLEFIQGDFTEETVLQKLTEMLNGKLADLIISDMSPNLSGISSVDQARAANLVEYVLFFAKDHLKQGNNCILKIFYGSEFNNLLSLTRELFEKVSIYKPKASRSESKEAYLLCENKKAL